MNYAQLSNTMDGPLAEFIALRSEMEIRGKHQHQIVALQLTITGAIFSYSLSRTDLQVLLLIIPITSYLLCGRYVGQHAGIIRIGRYIRDELSHRVPGGLHWEEWIRTKKRPNRLIGWFVPFLLTFPGATALALVWTSDLVSPLPATLPDTGGERLLLGIWWVGAASAVLQLYLLSRIFFRRRRIGTSPKLLTRTDAAVPG